MNGFVLVTKLISEKSKTSLHQSSKKNLESFEQEEFEKTPNSEDQSSKKFVTKLALQIFNLSPNSSFCVHHYVLHKAKYDNILDL